MPAETPLQPAGELTLADVIKFSYFHYALRFWSVTLLCLLFSLFGLITVLLTGDPERLQNPGFFYVIMLLFALLQLGLPYLCARKQYARLRYLREPMRYQFTNEMIRLEGPSFSGEITWPLVHSVYETRSTFLIYQSPQVAWILPKRFFCGESQEIQRWRQFVT
jgi:hypothetical protein